MKEYLMKWKQSRAGGQASTKWNIPEYWRKMWRKKVFECFIITNIFVAGYDTSFGIARENKEFLLFQISTITFLVSLKALDVKISLLNINSIALFSIFFCYQRHKFCILNYPHPLFRFWHLISPWIFFFCSAYALAESVIKMMVLAFHFKIFCFFFPSSSFYSKIISASTFCIGVRRLFRASSITFYSVFRFVEQSKKFPVPVMILLGDKHLAWRHQIHCFRRMIWSSCWNNFPNSGDTSHIFSAQTANRTQHVQIDK